MAIFMAVTYYNYCHSKAYAPGNMVIHASMFMCWNYN